MKIYIGSSRIVFVFDKIAFKFPKIAIIKYLKEFFVLFFWEKDSLTRTVKRYLTRRYLTGSVYSKNHPGLKYYLLNGLVSNWQEFLFWRKYKNIFCEPTYYSLFGLINIQRVSYPYDKIDRKSFWIKMQETPGYDRDDGHHFSNPKNFGIRKKQILIVDYGNPITQRVILKYGENITEHFSKILD
ncbi:MAG: hypothetical protein V1851_03210 [Patescibacteria group bacterium]